MGQVWWSETQTEHCTGDINKGRGGRYLYLCWCYDEQETSCEQRATQFEAEDNPDFTFDTTPSFQFDPDHNFILGGRYAQEGFPEEARDMPLEQVKAYCDQKCI